MVRNLIQDIFESYIVPSITTQFKNICYLSDDNGNIILSETGQMLHFPPEQNTWSLKFHHSSKTEWLTFLKSLSGSGNASDRYPFMFINANGITYSHDRKTVTISEIIFVNSSDVKYCAKEKDAYSIKPILWNLVDFFIIALNQAGNEISLENRVNPDYKISPIYSYGAIEMQGDDKKNNYADYIDAISITNLNLKISKTCNK